MFQGHAGRSSRSFLKLYEEPLAFGGFLGGFVGPSWASLWPCRSRLGPTLGGIGSVLDLRPPFVFSWGRHRLSGFSAWKPAAFERPAECSLGRKSGETANTDITHAI